MKHIYPKLVSWMLLLTPALTSESPHDAFKSALDQGNIEFIQELLTSHDIDINLQNGFGSTALMLAVDQKHITVCEQLLKRDDIDVNKQNRFGNTALMLAIREKNIKLTAQLLKRHDININLENNFGFTALMSAIREKHMLITKQILDHNKIKVNLKNKHGYTALIFAIFRNHISFAQLLLQRGDIDVNTQNSNGRAALMFAIIENHIPIAELLLQRHDIDVNLQDMYGSTALTLAIEEMRTTLADLLLKHKKINVNLQNSDRKNALACVKRDHIDLDKLQDNNLYYVDLVKRTQVPSLHKEHALLQPDYLKALYAQQPCNQAMQQYRDILLINKIANDLAEEQKTVFYQACLIAYEAKNSNYSIEAKGIESPKKSSQYQPVLDADLICLLAGYLREVAMKGVSDRSDWAHLITCYLWANNEFAMKQDTVNMTLKEVHFWHKQHSSYVEFLSAANHTQKRALFKVVAQQGEYEAVATKHLAYGLKQKNIIQSEEKVFKKSLIWITAMIVAGFKFFNHSFTIS